MTTMTGNGTVLARRLRACLHILRGRPVVHGFRNVEGAWTDDGHPRVIFTACTFAAGFTVNGVPAVEIADKHGEVKAGP